MSLDHARHYILVVLLVLFFVMFSKNIRTHNEQEKYFYFVLLRGLIGVLIDNLFNITLRILLVSFAFWFIFSTINNLNATNKKISLHKWVGILIFVLTCMVICALVNLQAKYFKAQTYELNGYKAEDLVRVDFLVGGHKIDALSIMCHRSEADAIGRETTKKLKEVIPRQNWEVAIQAAIGARIIARETIGAYRKDVTVKIHTGDRDRKAKLLEKQKRGKARMKRFGKIDIPSEAFTVMLRRD